MLSILLLSTAITISTVFGNGLMFCDSGVCQDCLFQCGMDCEFASASNTVCQQCTTQCAQLTAASAGPRFCDGGICQDCLSQCGMDCEFASATNSVCEQCSTQCEQLTAASTGPMFCDGGICQDCLSQCGMDCEFASATISICEQCTTQCDGLVVSNGPIYCDSGICQNCLFQCGMDCEFASASNSVCDQCTTQCAQLTAASTGPIFCDGGICQDCLIESCGDMDCEMASVNNMICNECEQQCSNFINGPNPPQIVEICEGHILDTCEYNFNSGDSSVYTCNSDGSYQIVTFLQSTDCTINPEMENAPGANGGMLSYIQANHPCCSSDTPLPTTPAPIMDTTHSGPIFCTNNECSSCLNNYMGCEVASAYNVLSSNCQEVCKNLNDSNTKYNYESHTKIGDNFNPSTCKRYDEYVIDWCNEIYKEDGSSASVILRCSEDNQLVTVTGYNGNSCGGETINSWDMTFECASNEDCNCVENNYPGEDCDWESVVYTW